jgi:FtsP/CotA-like multicopper oxidase with cupredoxin domain
LQLIRRAAMNLLNLKKRIVAIPLRGFVIAAMALLLVATAQAATPGIGANVPQIGSSQTFNLVAAPAELTQPDGVSIYSWGYGCASTVPGTTTAYTPNFLPVGMVAPFCPTMQVPGPTMIVTEGQIITVTLTNLLPPSAGNTSIAFPGFQVCAGTIAPSSVTPATPAGVCSPTTGDGVPGLQTQEAANNTTVTYQFVATTPGTRAYYSGTQPDLQIELGLYGAIVVLPKTQFTYSSPNMTATSGPNCSAVGHDVGQQLGGHTSDFRLATAAYDHPETCYDREYLFQWMEIDPVIHKQAEDQISAITACLTANVAGVICPNLNVKTEPWHPRYFVINGRSMPDDMDPDYAPNYPHQPYNGNPHMHPGDLTLIRVIGQGRWMHPFHEHANHVRILARDGNLILSQNDSQVPARLAGRMEFNTDTYPGQAFDGIFYWSGKGLGWDIYGHTPGSQNTQQCFPDINGYYTVHSSPPAPITAPNYYEWCADHNHPLEANPVVGIQTNQTPTNPCVNAATLPANAPAGCTPQGAIGGGGPATQFDPLVATNGLWYNGTPYLGHLAVENNRGYTPAAPGFNSMNPLPESGIAFMWHSHNEREITTNDVFPGGMLMMMLVDPADWYIDESL